MKKVAKRMIERKAEVKATESKFTRISFTLPLRCYNFVKREARKNGVSFETVIRECIRAAYIARCAST